MRLLPLIGATYFIVSGGPYGLEDIIGMAGYGRALLLLALVPLLWSLPTALMVGELASAIPEEGGFYIWVRRALGNFWGFQEAWLSLAASVFDMAIYPTTFVLYLSHLLPSLTTGHRGLALKLVIVLAATLWNLRGAKAVGDGSAGMMFVSLSPFAVLIAFGLWRAMHGGVGLHAASSSMGTRDIGGAISVAMWNYMGWDNASTIAQEVDNPQRNYPRAMLASALMVMLVYMLPLAAVWAAGIPADRFTTGAWIDAAKLLAGGWLALAIVLTGAMDGLGTFSALTLTLTRLPYVLALDGYLPKFLTPLNRRGVPWVSVLACAIAWACALGLTFERLISIDLVLYGSALILEFLALIVLRIREPELDRPFRVPGGLAGAIALGLGPALLIAFATAWALELGLTFEHLISSDLVIYGGALFLEFLALSVLRIRESELDRPFRVPGGTVGAIVLGVGPTVLIGFAMWSARSETVLGINALLFAASIALAGVLFYAAAEIYRRTQTPT